MKKIKFYASIWALDPREIMDYVRAFEETKTDGLHFDIMDGHYVPNLAMGTDEAKLWHSLTDIPLDVHCMAYNPERILEYYELREGDRVSFHPETCAQPYRLLQNLKKKGLKAGTYKLVVRVKAAGTTQYAAGKKDIVLTIRIK